MCGGEGGWGQRTVRAILLQALRYGVNIDSNYRVRWLQVLDRLLTSCTCGEQSVSGATSMYLVYL